MRPLTTRWLTLAALAALAVGTVACTPPDDTGGSASTTTTTIAATTTTLAPTTTTTLAPTTTTTTTVPSGGSAPTLTKVAYATSGVKLTFSAPITVPSGKTVTNYLYDISCNGGTTNVLTAQYLGTTSSGIVVFSPCADGTASSVRLAAVYNDSTSSTYSSWRTVTALLPPALTGAEYVTSGVLLSFTAPTVDVDQTVSNYKYDLSCDGGTTVTTPGSYLGTGTNPATVGNFCPDGTPSSYRLAAFVNGTWTSPFTAWRTVDPLAAPTLNSATKVGGSASLAYTAPTVSSHQTITNYKYDLSCNGGTTTFLAGQYVGNTANPAIAGNVCAGASSYRLSAVINGTWTSPASGWKTTAS